MDLTEQYPSKIGRCSRYPIPPQPLPLRRDEVTYILFALAEVIEDRLDALRTQLGTEALNALPPLRAVNHTICHGRTSVTSDMPVRHAGHPASDIATSGTDIFRRRHFRLRLFSFAF